MKARAKLSWWVLPSIVTGSVAALTALGTLAVNYATFATLPQRVEAGEKVNAKQDETLTELKAINKTWQEIYQQQQAAPNQADPRMESWQDPQGQWWCSSDGWQSWWRCDE